MPNDDPLADLRAHHPQALDLSAVRDRAFTAQERTAIIQAAQQARTTSEWLRSVAHIVGLLAKGIV